MRATTNQNVLLTPNTLSKTKSDSPSGTVELLAVPTRYSAVIPSRIKLVAKVTISGLRSRTATSRPLTRPITTATTKTVTIALGQPVVGSLRHADEHVGKSEMLAPIDRSMPPIMITNIWPRATIATTLPSGQQRAPRGRRERAGSDDPADHEQHRHRDPDRDETRAEQEVAEQRSYIESADTLAGASVRAADVVGHSHPCSPSLARLSRLPGSPSDRRAKIIYDPVEDGS